MSGAILVISGMFPQRRTMSNHIRARNILACAVIVLRCVSVNVSSGTLSMLQIIRLACATSSR